MTGRIFLADDEAGRARHRRVRAPARGFRGGDGHHGEAALSAARARPHDLVVLDVMMPGLSGTDVCRTLRAESDIPIILLTAKDAELDRALDLELGADDEAILATVYFFLRAFGLAPSVQNALLVQVTQSLSTILPFTPAGIGTEQALLVYVFAGELPTSALLGFSVGMKLSLIVVNLVLGLGSIALMIRTLRWRRLVEREQGLGATPSHASEI